MSEAPADTAAAPTAAPASRAELLDAAVQARFAGRLTRVASSVGEVTYELPAADILEVALTLRDTDGLKFEM